MKKMIAVWMASACMAGVALAQQSTALDGTAEVRNPVRLKAWLEANATDAEARLVVLESSLGTNVANEAVYVLNLSAGTFAVSTNATVGGTLGVTGAATLGAGSYAGSLTAGALAVSTNATVGGTLGVTGATTLGTAYSLAQTAGSLAVTTNATVGGTLYVGGGLWSTNVILEASGNTNTIVIRGGLISSWTVTP
jgi:hypothetical protein